MVRSEQGALVGAEAGFGEALRQLRTRRGLSLAELSRLTHYSKGYLSNIENGRKPPTADMARRLDDVLSGSLSDLVDTRYCPYLGLSAFGPGDTRWFFGRERTTAELLGRLAETLDRGRPLVVLGASGAGKSSVLHAGVRPALAGGVLPAPGSASWPVLVMTPTANPVQALCEKAAKLLGVPATDLSDNLGDWAALGPRRTRLVIVVDQFEEVFTLCSDEAQRRAFIAALCDGSGRSLVVLGVRADFYSRCLAYPELLDALQNNQFVVPPMNEDELVEAITGPARTAGLELEPGLVEVLLRDLGHGRDSMLPLLSHALLTTWQQRAGNRLTVAGYEVTGGIHGAVAATAERVYASLDDDGRQAVRRMLLALINVGEDEETRRRGDRDRLLEAGGSSLAAMNALAQARLLTLDREDVQITHEALLRAWPRLRDWIETDRAGLRIHQRLADAAQAWERHGRTEDLLHTGAALAGAKEWAEHHPDEPTAVEGEFLRTSAQHEQRGARRLKRLVAGLAVLSLVAVAGAGAALWSNARAQEQRTVAQVGKVMAEAPALHASNPGLAVQLSLAAYRLAADAASRGGLLSTVATPYFTRLDHPDTLTSVVFSPDGRRMATTDEDRSVRIFDATDPSAPPETLNGHTGFVTSSAFRPDGAMLATGSEDGTVRLWDIARVTPARIVRPPAGAVRSVSFSPDGRTLAMAGDDRVGRLWDVSEPTRPILLAALPGASEIAFNPDDGHTVATADGTVRLWDVSDPRNPVPLAEPDQAVDTLAFSPHGRMLATGSGNTARLWDVSTPASPAELGVLEAHTGAVNEVAFSPDGDSLATASADRTAILWDVTDPRQPGTLSVLTGHTEDVTTLAFAPDGHTLATGSWDNSARLWQIPGSDLWGHTDRVLSTAFTPDGRILASTGWDDTVRVWSTSDLGHPRVFTTITQPATVRGVAFRADGRLLAVADDSGSVSLWDLSAPDRPVLAGRLTGMAGSVRSVAFSPDGRTVLTGGEDHLGRLWDVSDPATPLELSILGGHADRVMTVAFGPDGRTVVTGSYDRTARVWDVTDPREPTRIATLTHHSHVVRSVAFSPDGSLLATGSWDRTARVWDVSDPSRPRDLATLTGHTGPVNAVTFDPGGRLLATAGDDGVVRLWTVEDPSRPTAYAVLTGHTDLVYALAFHPDEHTLVSAGRDRTVRLWETDAELAAERACELAESPITPGEWSAVFGDSSYAPPCR